MTARQRRVPHVGPARAVAATALVAALLCVAAPASAGPRDLIDSTPAKVSLAAPAPGHTQSWTMSVTSTSDTDVGLALEITGESGALFRGAHPLTITIVDADGASVLATTEVADVVGATLRLDDLRARASRELIGQVSLPREAGNAYQNADGELWLRFVAQAHESERDQDNPITRLPDMLARTGASVALTLAVATIAIVGGVGLLVMRRRREEDEENA